MFLCFNINKALKKKFIRWPRLAIYSQPKVAHNTSKKVGVQTDIIIRRTIQVVSSGSVICAQFQVQCYGQMQFHPKLHKDLGVFFAASHSFCQRQKLVNLRRVW